MTDDARHPLSRREVLKTATGAAAALSLGRSGSAQGTAPPPAQGATMMGVPFEKRAVVRVGLIGCGSRGPGHVGDLLGIEGVEIKAVCDVRLGELPSIYAVGDVCRPELLVEIEGIAFSTSCLRGQQSRLYNRECPSHDSEHGCWPGNNT